VGGKFLLRLNITSRPIVYKYRKGKVQRTLKRELKVLEIVEMEGIKNKQLGCMDRVLGGYKGSFQS